KQEGLKADSFRPFMRENVQRVIEPGVGLTDGKNPLSALHESFSRFNFTIIKEGKPMSMNMRWFSDVKDEANSYMEFREIAKIAKEEQLRARFSNSNASKPAGAATTLVFKSGNYTKGKTCVQVLKEDPDGRKHLEEQKKWLESNLSKYPNNKQFIDAINEALTLSQDSINEAKASVAYTMFASGMRHKLSSVLKGQRPQRNHSYENIPCYNGSIVFRPGMEYPLEVKITNFTSVVNVDDKGLGSIDMKKATNKVEASISLDFGETLRLFEELENYYVIQSRRAFEAGIDAGESIQRGNRASNSSKTSTTAKNEAKKETMEESKNDVEEKANAKPGLKRLTFLSVSKLDKADNNTFKLTAKYVSNGKVQDANYTIIIDSHETDGLTNEEFIAFRKLISEDETEFEMDCYKDKDGNIHLISLVS
ncbi:MAG: hypothetical protein IJ675_03565, partial [Pseudobutyrivibrio sp.]|nr:hypothetical protein [Pseudobutyrivibrio sp.]